MRHTETLRQDLSSSLFNKMLSQPDCGSVCGCILYILYVDSCFKCGNIFHHYCDQTNVAVILLQKALYVLKSSIN